MIKIQKHWLKRSILLPVILIMLIAFSFSVYSLSQFIIEWSYQEMLSDDTSKNTYWELELNHHKQKLTSIGSAMRQNSAIVDALIAQDREKLMAQAGPLLEGLSASEGMDIMTFLLPDHKVLLRAHKPQMYGDQGNLSVVRKAATLEKAVFGIDIGKDESIAVRFAQPWYREGHLIGFLVLGESLGHLLNHLDEVYYLRHMVLIDKALLYHKSVLIEGKVDAELAKVVDQTGHIISSSTIEHIPAPLLPLMKNHGFMPTADSRVISDKGKYYFRGLISLQDLGGKRIGGIMTLRDVSEFYHSLNLTRYKIIGISLILVAFLLVFLYRIISRAESLSIDTFEQIRQARDEWDHSFNAIGDPIFIHDEQFCVIQANRAYADKAKMRIDELIGKPYWEAFPRQQGPLAKCQHAVSDINNGTSNREQEEETIELENGETWVSRSFTILNQQQKHHFSIHILEEVTEREKLISSLSRENRARKVLSKSNQTLVTATEEASLLQTICDTLTEEGDYPLAWVGYSNNDSFGGLQYICSSGINRDELEHSLMSLNENNSHQSIASRCLLEGKRKISMNLKNDQDHPFSRDAGLYFGLESAAVFPLKQGDQTFGVLYIGAIGRHAFDGDEVELLNEVAMDMAFGVISLKSSEALTQAESSQLKVLAKLEQSLNKTVTAIATVVETRDPYTAGHQRHVSELAVAIAEELGLSFEQVESIRTASNIHDVGKIAIPAEILSKPTRLTPIEFELIKTHAQVGYDIIKDIDFPWRVADMVLQHHERLDGTGYPNGLKGDEILLESRIIAVADVFEAMSSHRPYRPALGIDIALEELERGQGSAFDPDVVNACIRLFKEKGMTLDSFFK